MKSLQKFHHYLGEVTAELSRRLTRIFLRGPDGRWPVHGVGC